MHDVPPTSSVFRHSYQVFLCSSGPCSYIIHPVDPRSSYSPSSRNRALNDLFSKHDPSFLMMCPNYFIFLSFTIPSNFLSTPAFPNTHLFVRFSVHNICIIILKHFISNASILLSSSFLIVQPSHPYIATGHTNVLRSSIFVVTLISRLFQILLRYAVATAYPFASRILISVAQSLSLVIADPKYAKVSTCSKVSSF